MQNLEGGNKTIKKTRKTKEKINRQLEDSIINGESNDYK